MSRIFTVIGKERAPKLQPKSSTHVPVPLHLTFTVAELAESVPGSSAAAAAAAARRRAGGSSGGAVAVMEEQQLLRRTGVMFDLTVGGGMGW